MRTQLFRFVFVLISVIGVICGYSYSAQAQGALLINKVRAVPATCSPVNNPVVFKTPATSGDTTSGFYICNPATNTYTFQTNTFGAGLTAKTMLYASASPVAITSTAAPTNGKLLIGSTGAVPALGTPTGTANEILVTLGAGTLNHGLATTVIHKAGTNFQFTDTTDTTKIFTFLASGITTGTTRTVTLPDANTIVPVATQILTFAGPTAARTITFPDAAITVARTDAANTFTGVQSFVNNLVPTVAGTPILGTSALPFGGLVIGGAASQGTTVTSNGTAARTAAFPDSNTLIPIASQVYTISGATAARTINTPDATSTTVAALTAVDSLVVNSVSTGTGVLGTTTVEARLSTTAAVDMNTATATTLYTCPSGRSCVITKVVVRNASTSLTTASYSFGWTSAAFADVIANATHTELTGATLYTRIDAKVGATLGTSTGTFKVLMNTLQGGAATTTIDVFGYTF